MLKEGQRVGSIQPYFLNETVTVNPKTDVDSQATAALQKAAQQTAELIADFRLTISVVESVVVGAINDAAKRGVTVRIAYDKTQDNPTLKNFAESGGDPAPVGTHTFLTTRGRFHANVHVKAVRHRPRSDP